MTPDWRHPRKRDLHFLNADGRVACNPRDREAAHRAEVEGIATEDPAAVTCRKCRDAMQREKEHEEDSGNNHHPA